MIKIIYFVNLSAVILSLAKFFAIFVVKKIEPYKSFKKIEEVDSLN